jgi:hypothetical protein
MKHKETQRCSKCILSAPFPQIAFDPDGVCNFCRDELMFTSEKQKINESGFKINKMIDEFRGKSEYDGILCYSGGKDSSYSLMLAIKKYKLNILSFTLDNGFLSKTAFDNINRVVDSLGVDHLTIKPSSEFFKSVIKACTLSDIYTPKTLTRISAGCNACISLVNILALKMALEKEIPFIFSGFTLGQIPVNSVVYKNNYNFFKDSREPVLEKLRAHVGEDIDKYYCIEEKLLSKVKAFPHNINILCLEDITENEIIEKIKPTGWVKPLDVDGCSSNCRLNTFNNHVHKKKLGYNPYELELSHLIRKGQMSRNEALDKINEQPVEQLQLIIRELGIDEKDINYNFAN